MYLGCSRDTYKPSDLLLYISCLIGDNSFIIGNCETGLAFDVQRRQTPDFVGDEQEKVDGDIGKVGMEGKQTEKRAHE